MRTVVAMAADGHVTVPEAARAELGLPDGGELELDVTDGALVLRPVDRLTPEEEAGVRRSRADYAAGRYRSDVSEEELIRLIERT